MFAALFAATVFGHALRTYLRTRDPMHRLLALIFAPTAAFAVVLALRLAGFAPPSVVGGALTAMYLFRPYFTLRLAGAVRPGPRWRAHAALAVAVALAGPALLLPRPYPPWFGLMLTLNVVLVEALAARAFLAESRRRTGTSAVRLQLAAWASYLTAGITIAAASGRAAGWTVDDRYTTLAALRPAGELVVALYALLMLLASVGYLLAFVPPLAVRRIWSANAIHAVGARVLDASATESPEHVWQRYVDVVRDMTSADGVTLVLSDPSGRLLHAACAGGIDCDGPGDGRVVDLVALMDEHQPVDLGSRGARRLPLAAHYAERVGPALLTATRLPASLGPGALLVANRHRSLFGEDDVRLLADLAPQAKVLADRSAVLAARERALDERGQALTEQRRLAEELAASVHALTAANNAKSDFLAAMSHELRTPLNAIIGFSDLLKSELAGDTTHGQWVGHIYSSGRHLLVLINELLDIAKVESGRFDLDRRWTPLDQAVTELVTAMRPLFDQRRLTVEVRVPALRALVDPLRFRQILENLLSNAVKCTGAGGAVTVEAEALGIDLKVRVIDTGVGIAPADLDRVFDEFTQVGDHSRRCGGTGLGLALVRRIARAHGGDITVRSVVGEGATFTVVLPGVFDHTAPDGDATDGDGGRPPMPPVLVQEQVDVAGVASSATARGRILVVDDDPRAAEVVSTQLHAGGYQVFLADTGEGGLEAALGIRPDAALLDVQLPGISGWETLRRWRADPGLAAVPVVMLTVSDEIHIGVELGASDHLVKPVSQERLLEVIDRLVARPAPPRDLAESSPARSGAADPV
ncbi:hypothetical protein GCM10010201_18510 [Pilimelia columellifera subsp. columellifera]|uniref:histidine kinase n=1 Tax=Pilimelia columellifera subsp. columellifera TaxID=706583 RepID=A0ABN3NFT2_9ACTN